jgi:flagellar export protein FliJ
MKRFRFTLQAVLTLRQREEQAAQERYARALLQRQLAAQQLALAEEQLLRAQADQRRLLNGASTAAKLATAHALVRAAGERHDHGVATLQHAERAAQQSLQAMLAARRAREAVERFQSQQRRRHDAATQREEQKLLDEFSRRLPLAGLPWASARN